MTPSVQLAQQAYDIVDSAASLNVSLKVAGGIGIWHHCPRAQATLAWTSRSLHDIDLVGYFADKHKIELLLSQLRFRVDPRVATIPGIRRSVFHIPDGGIQIDVSYDRLEFSHTIDMRRRLLVDHPTIPLAELLLQKLQVVEVNRKDILDIQMLLWEHEVGDQDSDTINGYLLAHLCALDWGLWKTVTTNLQKANDLTLSSVVIDTEDKQIIASRISQLLDRIRNRPKALRWKLRGLIGSRVRWFDDVEEIDCA